MTSLLHENISTKRCSSYVPNQKPNRPMQVIGSTVFYFDRNIKSQKFAKVVLKPQLLIGIIALTLFVSLFIVTNPCCLTLSNAYINVNWLDKDCAENSLSHPIISWWGKYNPCRKIATKDSPPVTSLLHNIWDAKWLREQQPNTLQQ